MEFTKQTLFQLTALEQALSSNDKNEIQIAAILSLLNMGIKNVPNGVLQKEFNDVSKRLLHILKEFVSSDNNVIMKSTFGILASLLKLQELAMWTHASTVQLFSAILNPFSIHTKPKVFYDIRSFYRNASTPYSNFIINTILYFISFGPN